MNLIKLVGHKTLFPVSKIMYVQGDGNYSMLRTDEGKQIHLPMTLKVIQRLTPQLVRIHKGHLINPDFVVRFANTWPNMVAVMADGQELSVSRMGIKVLKNQTAQALKGASFPQDKQLRAVTE